MEFHNHNVAQFSINTVAIESQAQRTWVTGTVVLFVMLPLERPTRQSEEQASLFSTGDHVPKPNQMILTLPSLTVQRKGVTKFIFFPA